MEYLNGDDGFIEEFFSRTNILEIDIEDLKK